MKKNSFLSLRKTLLIFGAALSFTSLQAQQWDNVGSSATISAGDGSFNNLVIDAQGNYYVSYYDLSVTKGSVQKFDGTNWSYVGGNPGITNGFATYSTLSINPAGTSLYYTNQGTGFEARKFESNAWSTLPSVTTAATNYQASAVSPDNTLFAYGSYGSGTVQKFVNGAWQQVGNAGIAGGVPFYAEMVIGTNGKIYIAHNTSGLKVYENNLSASPSDTWTMVGGASINPSYTDGGNATSDIAIGSDNTLYVVYASPSANNRRLNVKKFNGTSWVQVGDAEFGISNDLYNVSIAVTPAGKLYTVASGRSINGGKNTVYEYNATTNTWQTLGGDFVSDGSATYNDLQYDAANNNLVLTYAQSGIRVKKFSLNSLSVSDIKKNIASMYPNPTTGIINFKGDDKIKSVEVTNAVGRIIKSQNDVEKIDISDAPTGVYFVTVKTSKGNTSTKKVIKK